MNIIKKLVFVIFCLCVGFSSEAQIYPVQVTTQLAPPFSGYIGDYSTPGNQNLKLLVLFSDFTKPTYSIKLKMKISGQGITLQSKSYFYSQAFSVQPGIPFEISGSDLAELLNTNNLDFSGISVQQYEEKKALPEGFYNICFIAYDNNNPTQIQVSNESCAAGWMVLSDPPFLNLPLCGSTIKTIDPQNIFFQWTPMNLTSPNSVNSTVYDFELYEIKPGTQSPGNIIQTLPPIYKITTPLTFVNYGMTEPQLYPSMEYVWRVRAHDESNRDLFKNQGYSQFCTFMYGSKFSQLDSNTLKLNLKGTPVSYRMIKYSWDSLSIFTSYHFEYRKKGGTNWFPVLTTEAKTNVLNLEPESTYEARVKGITEEDEGPWSNIVSVTTPAKPIIVCGQSATPPSMDNFKPLATGRAGQVWNVGQFEMLVTQLVVPNNTSGVYSGYGKIEIPFLAGLNLTGKFDDVLMNEEMTLVKGEITIVSEGREGGNIVNLDSVFKEIDSWFDDYEKTGDDSSLLMKIDLLRDLYCPSASGTDPPLTCSKDNSQILGMIKDKSSIGLLKADVKKLVASGSSAVCEFGGGKYFLAPNGLVFMMPADGKVLMTISGYSDYAAYGFTTDNKQYIADIPAVQGSNDFFGFKSKESTYKLSYLNKASNVHVLKKNDKGGISIYVIKTYTAPESKDAREDNTVRTINQDHVIENQASFDEMKFVFSCSGKKQTDAKEKTPEELVNAFEKDAIKVSTFIYQNGQLITLSATGNKIEPMSDEKFRELLKQIEEGKSFSENAAVVFEKTAAGYKTHVGFKNTLKPKNDKVPNVKEECAQILEQKANAFLQGKDLTASVPKPSEGTYTDGKQFSFAIDQSYCSLIRNVVHDAATFIQEAQIPEVYYDDKNPGHAKNWVNTPPLLTGVANGVIEEIKDIPVLVAFGADIAMNPKTRQDLKAGLSKLTSLDGIKAAAKSSLKGWTDKYAQGGDKAWHQAGKDGVMVFSAVKAGALFFGAFKDGIEKHTDEIADVVDDAGKVASWAAKFPKFAARLEAWKALELVVEEGDGFIKVLSKNGDEIANVFKEGSEEVLEISDDFFKATGKNITPIDGINLRTNTGESVVGGGFVKNADGSIGFVEDVSSYGSNLVKNAIRGRGDLRAALAGIKATEDAHHIIPVQLLKENKIVQMAVEGGFDFNSTINGIGIEKFVKATGAGRHGPHPNYTAQIRKNLETFSTTKNLTPQMCKEYLEEITKDIRNTITTTTGKINEIDLNLN